MKFIYRYIKKYIPAIALGITIKTLASVGELLIPYVLEYILDEVVLTKQVSLILGWGLAMVVLSILVRWLNIKANRMAVKTSALCNYDIRRDLFSKSINLSEGQVDEIGLPSLTARMTSDSYNLQNFVRSMQTMGVRAPILFIGGIAITLIMDRRLAMVLCVLAPLMMFIMVYVSLKGIPLYEKVQESLDEIVRIMRENITGIRVVKALSKEDYEKRRYESANKTMAGRDIKAGVVMALPSPMVSLVLNIGLSLVVLVGAHLVNDGYTKPGVILAFLTYFNMLMNGTNGISKIFIMMSKANASAGRIAAVIDWQEEMTPLLESECAHTDREGYIVFDHVSFSYGKEDLASGHIRENCLKDIDFEIKKGQSLGIIGSTGSGKTTIINLLMRFYDSTAGHIFIDGRDVRSFDKDELHKKFGVVFQNDVIFADALRENINFGRDLDDDRIWEAAKDAYASDFIEKYDDGLSHEATIMGANLSGGQKQRILISRALAAKPDILILDDSSSALDYRTDARIRTAINKSYQNTTTIIVAQRISSLMNLDHIMVMDEGEIIGYGTHEELMKSCSMYADIYDTQMKSDAEQ